MAMAPSCSSANIQSRILLLIIIIIIIIIILSPSFAEQSFRPPKARRLVLVTMRTTTAPQPQLEAQPIQDDHRHPNNAENHRTSTTSSYDILSIIRLGFMIVLLLILLLSALLKLISLLKGRDTRPLPIHHAAAANQPSQNPFVMQLQQAPLAPSHPHNALLSLSFTERLSMDADVDHVEIDDV
ncbi:hypothetical protein M0R45_032272 [Rubus argutus]|uniref:Transmembrane protein n=1 Tax=Rubus argutus TaxID=59490 RepID=A0AAW1WGE6_RUBAR